MVELNFEVPAGTNYQIGTDAEVNVSSVGGENPQLKRTGTNGGLSYPYVLDGKVSINKAVYYGQGVDGSGGDDYTTYYYYLYNWVISGEPIECDPVIFPVTVEDCSSIDEVLVDMSVYPNPTEGLVAVSLNLKTVFIGSFSGLILGYFFRFYSISFDLKILVLILLYL